MSTAERELSVGMAVRPQYLSEARPWLTDGAIQFLENHVWSTHQVLEFGSGGSTIFLAERAFHVFSFESRVSWYCAVCDELEKRELENAEVVLIATNGWREPAYESLFKRLIFPGLLEDYFDWLVIDGKARFACLERGRESVKPGGWIVFDNYGRKTWNKALRKFVGDWECEVFDGPDEYDGLGTAFYRRPYV